MAIVVESVSTASWVTSIDPNISLTITKPTGVAVGDMLVACIVDGGGAPPPEVTVSSTGWTLLRASTGAETFTLWQFYRVATSSDVSASNYEFTTNYDGVGTAKMTGCILRLSGVANSATPTATDGIDNNKLSTAMSVSGLSITPPANNSLLVLAVLGANNEVGSGSFSGYTINGTNPTWTEHMDSINLTVDDSTFAVATAIMSTAAEITTISATHSVMQDDYIALLGVFREAVSASGTTTLLTPNTNFHAPSASAGVSGTVASLHSVSPTINNADGSTNTSQWTKETKENTTWTNEQSL